MFGFKQANLTRGGDTAEVDLAILRLLIRKRLPTAGSRVLDVSSYRSRWQEDLDWRFATSSLDSLDPTICDVGGDEYGSLFEYPKNGFDLVVWRSMSIRPKKVPSLLCKCADYLDEGGRLIVVSLNPSMARERLACFENDRRGESNSVENPAEVRGIRAPIMKMIDYVHAAGLRITHLEYTPACVAELRALPLAALIWLGQNYYFRRVKSKYRRMHLDAMFSMQALLSRHYILICERKSGEWECSD